MSFLQAPPMCATMAGRIETYVHSDSTTANKGGCIVRVTCGTDFGARTKEFVQFAKRVAQLSYGADAETWEDVVEVRCFPELERERQQLQEFLKERVTVQEIVILKI